MRGRLTVWPAVVAVLTIATNQLCWAVSLPTRSFPKNDVLLGPFTMTAAAGGMWEHDTEILTDKMYNVDAAGQTIQSVRVTADRFGLVTVPKFQLTQCKGNRLILSK